MYNNINAPVIPNPVMLDRVIGEIQQGLADNLPWLDAAFGRAQRLSKMINGKMVITPNVYCGGWNGHGDNDYIEVSPDSKIGNFSYFEIEDPQTIDGGPWARDITCPFSLIVWVDLTRVYGMPDNRNTEYIKAEILRVLNGRAGWHLGQGRITINQIYERAENVYRGYSLSEIDNQFLMHPYAGFRFAGTLQYMEMCFEYTPEPIPPTPGPVVPVVPPEAIQFYTPRFAFDVVGDGEFVRILGNSYKINNELQNLMLQRFDIVGYNQIDPEDIISESTGSGYYNRSRVFKVIHGKQYVVHYVDAFEGQTSNYRMLTSMDGITWSDTMAIERDTPFTFSDSALFAVLAYNFAYGAYNNDMIVAIYDEELIGSPEYYHKTIELDVTKLSGYDANGRIIPLFSEGLLKAGNDVRDEIFETVAVRRVGMRAYMPGDELNPAYLTDGTITNYPLPEPEVFNIVEHLDFSFVAERGGTCFQTPETPATSVDIIIE